MAKLKQKLIKAELNLVETGVKLIPDPVPDPLREARNFLGKPYSRVDGVLKVTGQALYASEHPMERLTHAALVHSPIAKGRIAFIDSKEAEAIPGVLLV